MYRVDSRLLAGSRASAVQSWKTAEQLANRISPCRPDAVRSASTVAVALYHLRGHTRPPQPPPPRGCVLSSSTASGSTTTVSTCTALTGLHHHQHRLAQLPPSACPVITPVITPPRDLQDDSTTRRWRATAAARAAHEVPKTRQSSRWPPMWKPRRPCQIPPRSVQQRTRLARSRLEG